MDPNMIMILTVLALILLDIITGVVKAFKDGTFSSSEMRAGLIRKSGTIALLFLAYGLQWVSQISPNMPQELGIVFDGIAAYILIMEIASNVENILSINPELGGDSIRGLFGMTKDKDTKDDGKE